VRTTRQGNFRPVNIRRWFQKFAEAFNLLLALASIKEMRADGCQNKLTDIQAEILDSESKHGL
jgi:hypothetical protein